MNIRHLVFNFATIAVLFAGCSPDIASNGGGSGTLTTNGICVASGENSLKGYIYSVKDGDTLNELPADFNVSLQVFSTEYQPHNHRGLMMTLVPESSGIFGCDTLKPGVYNLLAFEMPGIHGVFVDSIIVGKTIHGTISRKLFSSCGTINGTVIDSSKIAAGRMGIYINGTPFFALTGSSGLFSLTGIPEGDYTLCSDYFYANSDSSYVRVKGNMRSGDTIVIYTDSVSVNIRPDSMVYTIRMSL